MFNFRDTIQKEIIIIIVHFVILQEISSFTFNALYIHFIGIEKILNLARACLKVLGKKSVINFSIINIVKKFEASGMMVGKFLSGLHGEGDVAAWLATSLAAFQALAAARLANHISQRLHVKPQKSRKIYFAQSR